MKNWIRIGEHYINLKQVTDIVTDCTRKNYKSLDDYRNVSLEPCIIFFLSVEETQDEYGGHGPREICFFGKERENILEWLANEVELEITNLNFIETIRN